MSERRFTETELATILRLAAESQAKTTPLPVEATGYTLSEIERLAGEVGIDPKHVLLAAGSIPEPPVVKKRFRLFAAPFAQTVEYDIRGHLDDAAWEEAVQIFRSKFRVAGTASVVGTMREWTGGSEWRAIHLSARRRGENTRISFQINQRDTVLTAWLSGVILAVFAAVVSGALLRNLHMLDDIGFTIAPLAVYFLTHRFVSEWHTTGREACLSIRDDLQSAVDVAASQSELRPMLTDSPQELTGSLA